MFQCFIWPLDLGLQVHWGWEFWWCLSVPLGFHLTHHWFCGWLAPSHPPHPGQPSVLLCGWGSLYGIDDAHNFPAVLILEDITPRAVCSSCFWAACHRQGRLPLLGFKWRLAHSWPSLLLPRPDPGEAVATCFHVLPGPQKFLNCLWPQFLCSDLTLGQLPAPSWLDMPSPFKGKR